MYDHIPNEIWDSWAARAKQMAKGSVGRRLLPYIPGEIGTMKAMDPEILSGIEANILWCYSKAFRMGIDEQSVLEGVYVTNHNTLEFRKWFKEMRLVESGFLDEPIAYVQDPGVDVARSGYRIQARGRKGTVYLYGDYVTGTAESQRDVGNKDALHDNPLAVLQGRALSDFISKHARNLFVGAGKGSIPPSGYTKPATEDTREAAVPAENLDEDLLTRRMAMVSPAITACAAPRASAPAARPAPAAAKPSAAVAPASTPANEGAPVPERRKPGPKPGWKDAKRANEQAGSREPIKVVEVPAAAAPLTPATPSDSVLDMGRRNGAHKDDADIDGMMPAKRTAPPQL